MPCRNFLRAREQTWGLCGRFVWRPPEAGCISQGQLANTKPKPGKRLVTRVGLFVDEPVFLEGEPLALDCGATQRCLSCGPSVLRGSRAGCSVSLLSLRPTDLGYHPFALCLSCDHVHLPDALSLGGSQPVGDLRNGAPEIPSLGQEPYYPSHSSGMSQTSKMETPRVFLQA